MSNYIDEKGNYINSENLSLAEIYARGIEAGRQQKTEERATRRLRSDIQKSNTDLTTYWRQPTKPTTPGLDVVICNNCVMAALRSTVQDYAFCPYCGASVKPAPASETMNAEVTRETDEARELIEEERLLDRDDDCITRGGRE